MKLISSFSDYYDGAIRSMDPAGSDGFYYIRKVESDVTHPFISDKCYHGNLWDFGVNNSLGGNLVGFCGKTYFGYTIPINKNGEIAIKAGFAEHKTFFDFQSLDAHVKKTMNRKDYLLCFPHQYRSAPVINLKSIKQAFSKFQLKYERPHSIWDSELRPSFNFNMGYRDENGEGLLPRKLVWGGSLKRLDFYKVFDSYQAAQELLMWVSSRAYPDTYVPEMDNKTRIEQHGFDLKHSFRSSKRNKSNG